MVHFVGAGSGAPDLITVRGAEQLAEADVVIYAGSLVNPELLQYVKPSCQIFNSAAMTLDEIVDTMEQYARQEKVIVRLHTGEPSIYGAISEQMQRLRELGIPYDCTPGVTAAFGAAASLKMEFTLPNGSQSLIITRMEGRTRVPQTESIESFAKHQSSMAVYLSAKEAERLREQLLKGGYPPDTPIAVVYKATWDDEKIIISTLRDFPDRMEAEGITRHAVILVGTAVGQQETGGSSRLYDPGFSTSFRSAGEEETGLQIIAFTAQGKCLAKQLKDLSVEENVSIYYTGEQKEPVANIVKRSFKYRTPLLFIGAMGICTRLIAPYMMDKLHDIAVAVMDETGRYVIPVLSGHVGGANNLARKISRVTGAEAVITTATDLHGLFAIDEFAVKRHLLILNKEGIRRISSKLLSGQCVTIAVQDDRFVVGEDGLPERVRIKPWKEYLFDNKQKENEINSNKIKENTDICISEDLSEGAILHLRPKPYVLGIGCRKGIAVSDLENTVTRLLYRTGVSIEEVDGVATIDRKKNEGALQVLCRKYILHLKTYNVDELKNIPGEFGHSDFVEKTVGVDNVCERAAVCYAMERGGVEEQIIPKTASDGVTVAVYRYRWKVRIP